MTSDRFFPASFEVVGYGCMTCIGNSGPLPEEVVEAITQVAPPLPGSERARMGA